MIARNIIWLTSCSFMMIDEIYRHKNTLYEPHKALSQLTLDDALKLTQQ